MISKANLAAARRRYQTQTARKARFSGLPANKHTSAPEKVQSPGQPPSARWDGASRHSVTAIYSHHATAPRPDPAWPAWVAGAAPAAPRSRFAPSKAAGLGGK